MSLTDADIWAEQHQPPSDALPPLAERVDVTDDDLRCHRCDRFLGVRALETKDAYYCSAECAVLAGARVAS